MTLWACDPSLIMLRNSAFIRLYWCLPNSLEDKTSWSGPAIPLNASANSVIKPMKLPRLLLAIFSRSIPNPWATSRACLVGAIRLAKPDFRALAPSAAPTPPSRIAVKRTERSSMLPPRPLMVGATRGIADVMSSRLVTVWFSTALRKFVFSARSSVATPKADCIEIVASSAC